MMQMIFVHNIDEFRMKRMILFYITVQGNLRICTDWNEDRPGIQYSYQFVNFKLTQI